MEGIYYKDGVYVLIDNDDKHENCIYHYNYRDNELLYGGRVRIKYSQHKTAYFYIGGVEIVKLDTNNVAIEKSLELSSICNYLNAIEVHGVDAFLEHYKKTLEQLKSDLSALKNESMEELSTLRDESLIETVKKEIKKIKSLIYYIICVVFTISTFMNAGLENEKVISVYQSIIDTIV